MPALRPSSCTRGTESSTRFRENILENAIMAKVSMLAIAILREFQRLEEFATEMCKMVEALTNFSHFRLISKLIPS